MGNTHIQVNTVDNKSSLPLHVKCNDSQSKIIPANAKHSFDNIEITFFDNNGSEVLIDEHNKISGDLVFTCSNSEMIVIDRCNDNKIPSLSLNWFLALRNVCVINLTQSSTDLFLIAITDLFGTSYVNGIECETMFGLDSSKIEEHQIDGMTISTKRRNIEFCSASDSLNPLCYVTYKDYIKINEINNVSGRNINISSYKHERGSKLSNSNHALKSGNKYNSKDKNGFILIKNIKLGNNLVQYKCGNNYTNGITMHIVKNGNYYKATFYDDSKYVTNIINRTSSCITVSIVNKDQKVILGDSFESVLDVIDIFTCSGNGINYQSLNVGKISVDGYIFDLTQIDPNTTKVEIYDELGG